MHCVLIPIALSLQVEVKDSQNNPASPDQLKTASGQPLRMELRGKNQAELGTRGLTRDTQTLKPEILTLRVLARDSQTFKPEILTLRAFTSRP